MECNFSSVRGTLKVPASKSYTQRALVAAMLHSGTTDILHPGNSADEHAVLSIVKQQATVTPLEQGWRIIADGTHTFKGIFNCGESGLAARLLVPAAALSEQVVEIHAEGSLRTRPMDFFDTVLPQLGVTIRHLSTQAGLPISVQGPLIPADIEVDGSVSSQFISGLLFAFAFSAQQKLSIRVQHAVSTPYLDMTCAVLENFGKKILRQEENIFELDPKAYVKREYVALEIESDWSSAAFWICAAALNGSIHLEGLQKDSLQADRHILSILSQIGARYHFSGNTLSIHSYGRSAFTTDLTHCPDLFPVLSVLAAGCSGHSRLVGLHRLRHKESDRAAAIFALLQQLSIPFYISEDTLIIEGGKPRPNKHLEVPADHRMVMAAVLAAMFSSESITVSHADSVAKSYPDFFKDLQKHTE